METKAVKFEIFVLYLFIIQNLALKIPEQLMSVGGKCSSFKRLPQYPDEDSFEIPSFLVRYNEYNLTWIPARMQDKSTRCNDRTADLLTVSWNDYQPISSDLGLLKGIRSFVSILNISEPIPIHFSRDGMFFNGSYYFSPENDYCIESYSSHSLILRLCPPNPPTDIFLPKCCPMDELISPQQTCLQMNQPSLKWKPDLYPEAGVRGPSLTNRERYIWYQVEPFTTKCHPNSTLDWWSPTGMGTGQYHKIKLVVRSNGTVVPLVYQNSSREWIINANVPFCVDATYDKTGPGNGNSSVVTFRRNSNDIVVYYCRFDKVVNNNKKPEKSWVFIVAISAYLISCVFLLATVVVYLLLLKEHHLYGLLILAYNFSMLGRYFFAAFMVLMMMTSNLDYFGLRTLHWPCVLIGLLLHYFQTANYFCILTLNVDRLLTIRSTQLAAVKGKQLGKFMRYMAFAWGASFLLIGAFLLVDTVYRDPYTEVPVPGYGEKVCFVSRTVWGYYVFLPNGVLVGLNFVLIVALIYTLCKAQQFRNNSFNDKKDSAQTTGSSMMGVSVVIKVFLVMGGTDAVRFFEWYFHEPTQGNDHTGPLWFFVLDVLKVVVCPVVLFYLFCCTNPIREKLKNKFTSLRK